MKTFLSYAFHDLRFVELVYDYLAQQRPRIDPYFYSSVRTCQPWPVQLAKALEESEAFVLFVGDRLGQTQSAEMRTAKLMSRKIVCVRLTETPDPEAAPLCGDLDPVRTAPPQGRPPGSLEALKCAQQIVDMLEVKWIATDGIPRRYVFDYERQIIDFYLKEPVEPGDGAVPSGWPEVEEVPFTHSVENPLPAGVIGEYRGTSNRVAVHARGTQAGSASSPGSSDRTLFLPEAGPRATLKYPSGNHPHKLRVGVLVSGGIAPGINAVLAGLVNRHFHYAKPAAASQCPPGNDPGPDYEIEVFGYREGFKGLLKRAGGPLSLTPDLVNKEAHKGGSLLGTSRVPGLLAPPTENHGGAIRGVLDRLDIDQIEILYVIGGDGSMRAAHAIWNIARQSDPGSELSVVGIPKTMDNDILWVWQSFGFLSAVEKAREAILNLQTEVQSNPRLCVVQLFGSDSGFVVAHAVLASGGCDYALIPEAGFSMKALCGRMKQLLTRRYKKDQRPHALIVMSETAIPRDVADYMSDVPLTAAERTAIERFAGLAHGPHDPSWNWRVQGQTPDELRTGGLKVVTHVLQEEIRRIPGYDGYWGDFRVFANEPRHLIRAIPPSVSDVIFGQRLGTLAVDNAMAGYTDFMVSQWLTEYVLVPLKLVTLGRKRVPRTGIFWKSVLASTGQPDEAPIA